MAKPRLTFGEREGSLHHIDAVESGLACRCTCPACGSELIARKGSKVVHHFGHKPGSDCPKAVETALHRVAKEVLAAERKIRLPPVEVKFDSYKYPWLLSSERTVALDEVLLETADGDIVPDLSVAIGPRRLFIEIVVTHGIDDVKREKLRARGVSTLVVDLSDLARDATRPAIAGAVVEGTDKKSWALNARAEEVRREAEALGRPLETVSRGMATHVDGCPIAARRYRGKPYANVLQDCLYCEFNVAGGFEGLRCLGFVGIATYEEFLRHRAERRRPAASPSAIDDD